MVMKDEVPPGRRERLLQHKYCGLPEILSKN